MIMAKILIAEDDSSMRQFLTMALRRAGHEVEAKEDGLSAFAALEADKSFELLLSDIIMPGMDGIELSQKATAANPALKVMFITGFAGIARDRAISAPDETKILAKPFHLKELVDQIEHLLAA